MLQLPLPDAGAVTIGRGREVDARLDAPSISRRHALLRISDASEITIEDLGSANGTKVRGELLVAHVPVSLRLGEIVDLGSILVSIQRHAQVDRARRIWSHAFFEAHLEEACLRVQHGGDAAAFGVLAICGTVDEQVLSSALRPVDVVGLYAPGEYEVMLVDLPPAQAEQLAARVRAALGRGATVEVATCPRDGRSPDALLAAVRRIDAEPSRALVSSAAMGDLHRLVERVAPGTISVLILGETGVGKEVLAESVHRASKRASKPYLKLNCAALSESLLESELFGHERGSFTGAVGTKPGLLETADGGTVFLDELGELPLSIQVKLLRVIEDRTVLRVGGLKPTPIDVRFVAATNRDLETEIERGTFRQDLFFRLNGISLVIPPLRERVAEIAGLAAAFLKATWDRLERDERMPRISPEAISLLESYAWPGNIRELRNALERAALLCTNQVITPDHLPTDRMRPRTAARPAPLAPVSVSSRGTLPQSVKREVEVVEKQRILDALEECAGNQTHAARMLGISRATLVSRLDLYGIKRPRKPR